MQYQGRWLIGSLANQRVTSLQSRLNEKTLARVNQTLEKDFTHFQPWMTYKDKVGQGIVFHPSSNLFPSPEYLADLHRFLANQEGPLGSLNLKVNDFQVLHEDESAIDSFYRVVN